MWTIPYTIYTYYLSLYLKSSGITDMQLGTLMIIGNVAGLIAAVLSAPVTDMLGRKNTTLVFDLISSVVPPLVYLVTSSYPFAIFAMVCANLNRIMSLGYYLTIIEDSSEKTSVVALNMFNMILVAAGLLTPLAGIVVKKLGIVDAERLFLLISAVSMTVLALWRHALLHETEMGVEAKLKWKERKNSDASLKSTLSSYVLPYKTSFSYLLKDKRAALALSINVLIYVYYAVGTSVSLYFAPFFVDHLHLSNSALSLVGGIHAGGTLLAMVLINPLMNRKNLPIYATVAGVITIVGSLLLVIFPSLSTTGVLMVVALVGLGFGILKTAGDSVLALETAGEFRTGVYALSYVISSLVTIVILQALSLLYNRFAGWLFIMSALLALGTSLLALVLRAQRSEINVEL